MEKSLEISGKLSLNCADAEFKRQSQEARLRCDEMLGRLRGWPVYRNYMAMRKFKGNLCGTWGRQCPHSRREDSTLVVEKIIAFHCIFFAVHCQRRLWDHGGPDKCNLQY